MATKNKRKGGVSEETITRRGLAIYQKGDQIKAISKLGRGLSEQRQAIQGIVCHIRTHMRVQIPYHRKWNKMQAHICRALDARRG